MKYAQVVPFEVCNGKGIGTSLFVQGCDMHCFNCFNSSAWDFNGGKAWNSDVKNKFINAISKPYIKRISILGGEPLAKQNTEEVLSIVKEIKNTMPNKIIWLYSGYTFDQIMNPVVTDDFNPDKDIWIKQRKEIVKLCDVLVDGRYVDNLKNIALPFKGSSNQKIWRKQNNEWEVWEIV